MKASDLLVKCLEEEGIEYIFGVPGEENADFMISLEQSKQIKFILTRHEQGAAFMAEIYGRLTGNPAVCLGTLGPGATNLITGVADSNMDRAPMLVLTGQGSTDRLHKESHQIMDVVAMFRPVTKWATTILNPDTIPEIIRKAVRLARTEKPGAVHIELPEDIAGMDSSAAAMESRHRCAWLTRFWAGPAANKMRPQKAAAAQVIKLSCRYGGEINLAFEKAANQVGNFLAVGF